MAQFAAMIQMCLSCFAYLISKREIWTEAEFLNKSMFIAIHNGKEALPRNFLHNWLSYLAITKCNTTRQFSGHWKKFSLGQWIFFMLNNLTLLLIEQPLKWKIQKNLYWNIYSISSSSSVNELWWEFHKIANPEILSETSDDLSDDADKL